MSRDRFVLYTLLGLVLIAVIGLAFIISFRKHQAMQQRVSPRAENTRSVPAKPDYDFTTLLPEDTASSIAAKPQQKKDNLPLTQPTAQYVAPTGKPVTLRVEPVRVEPMRVGPSAQLPISVSSSPSVTPSKSLKNLVASNSRPARSYSATEQGGTAVPTSHYEGKSAKDPSKPSSGEQILDAYTPYQTISQQRALNQKIQDMRDGVDRALMVAMASKGKREQNLEKYMPSTGEDSAANTSSSAATNADATSEVSRQLAVQARQVVSQMRRNYGDAVAGQASAIMNDFQQEMASLLNSPLSSEEKMIKAQELNNKYNGKLQKLNESAGKSKMEEQLQHENAEHLNKITETYGAEVADIASPILDKYAALRLANWTTPQSEAEAIANEAALQDQMYKELGKVLNSRGYRGDVTPILEEPTRRQISEQGPDNTPIFRQTAEGQAARVESWKKEGQEIVNTFSQLGDNAKQEAQQLVNGLVEDRNKLYQQAQEEGWTKKQLVKKEMDLVDQFNQKSKNLYNTTVAGNYNKQYEQRYQNMPEDVKRQMRPIWQKGNLKLAELDNTLMKEEDRKKQKEQILQEMEKEMQEILQNAQ